jgi:hypothetical protein
MELPTFRMMCKDHGEARPCRVCPHLSVKRASGRGFNGAQEPDPDPKWAPVHEAWCDKCDFWFRRAKPLPDIFRFLAGGSVVVCEYCFELVRIGNERPGNKPGWWERKKEEKT